jgi:hypothetical protein
MVPGSQRPRRAALSFPQSRWAADGCALLKDRACDFSPASYQHESGWKGRDFKTKQQRWSSACPASSLPDGEGDTELSSGLAGMLGGPQQLLTSVFQAGSAPRSESKRKRLFFTNANFPWFIYTTNKTTWKWNTTSPGKMQSLRPIQNKNNGSKEWKNEKWSKASNDLC